MQYKINKSDISIVIWIRLEDPYNIIKKIV